MCEFLSCFRFSRQPMCWVQRSTNISLPLLQGCTASSVPQHLASLTQSASSSSRRVSPLCSPELSVALSQNRAEALGVNKGVQWGPRVNPTARGGKKNTPSFWLSACLSAAWVYLCTYKLQLDVFVYINDGGIFIPSFPDSKIMSECVFLPVLIVGCTQISNARGIIPECSPRLQCFTLFLIKQSTQHLLIPLLILILILDIFFFLIISLLFASQS